MSKNRFRDMYRETMDHALGPLGFSRKRNVYWREQGGILHLVALERAYADSFMTHIAIQPLVFPFPFDAFILGLGGELYRMAPQTPHTWMVPDDQTELGLVLERHCRAVLTYGVPWLDRFPSTRAVVEIDAHDDWRVSPIERTARLEMVGFCALDAKCYARAKELLWTAYYGADYEHAEGRFQEVGMEVPQWVIERRAQLKELFGWLASGDHGSIHRRLAEYRQQTWENLGLTKAGSG